MIPDGCESLDYGSCFCSTIKVGLVFIMPSHTPDPPSLVSGYLNFPGRIRINGNVRSYKGLFHTVC